MAAVSVASSSWETCAIARFAGISNVPASGCSSPRMSARRLDLPLPFSPVMPIFSPRNNPKVAFENSIRGPRRIVTAVKLSMWTDSARAARLCPDVESAILRERIDPAQLLVAEMNIAQCAQAVLDLGPLAGADQRAGHNGLAQHPGDGHLCQRLTTLACQLIQRTHTGQIALRQQSATEGTVLCRPRLGRHTLQVLGREQPLGQRREGNAADAFGLQDL